MDRLFFTILYYYPSGPPFGLRQSHVVTLEIADLARTRKNCKLMYIVVTYGVLLHRSYGEASWREYFQENVHTFPRSKWAATRIL